MDFLDIVVDGATVYLVNMVAGIETSVITSTLCKVVSSTPKKASRIPLAFTTQRKDKEHTGLFYPPHSKLFQSLELLLHLLLHLRQIFRDLSTTLQGTRVDDIFNQLWDTIESCLNTADIFVSLPGLLDDTYLTILLASENSFPWTSVITASRTSLA